MEEKRSKAKSRPKKEVEDEVTSASAGSVYSFDINEAKGLAIGDGARVINTGGGVYVEGTVSTGGGDFVGRDKIVYGDKIQKNELRIQFAALIEQIQAMEEEDDVDKEDIIEIVKKLRDEVAKGKSANLSKVERWIRFLADMSLDVQALVINTLQQPLEGVMPEVRQLAAKAKE